MKQVLLSVAPVSASANKLEPNQVVEDVLQCAESGAGMVHLHVRGLDNALTANTTVFEGMIKKIRQQSDIIIQASTGGVSRLNIKERCAPLALGEVECASLNVGSVNLGGLVYQNPKAEVEFCAKEIKSRNIVPEIEVFEIGMIETSLRLQQDLFLREPFLFSIVLGHEGGAPPTIEALLALRGFIPKEMIWGITHFRRKNNRLIAAAVAAGAQTIRIGFEDSDYISHGKIAEKNVEIVGQMKGLLEYLECVPMSAASARELLKIPALTLFGGMI